MWTAIKRFFIKIIWPSTTTLFNKLTPIVAETAIKLAYNKAGEIKGQMNKNERQYIEKDLINDLKAQGLTIGVDFALEEIEDAAKLAIKKANEL